MTIPDKMIEQAASEANHAYRESAADGKPGNPIVEHDRAFARVIATWAREQERDRIRKVISEFQDRAYTRDGEYIDVPYWEGAFDLVGHLEDRLPSLDREGDQ